MRFNENQCEYRVIGKIRIIDDDVLIEYALINCLARIHRINTGEFDGENTNL